MKDYIIVRENSVCDGATATCTCGIDSGDCNCGDCGQCGATFRVKRGQTEVKNEKGTYRLNNKGEFTKVD
jgi:hypothetical protein